MQKILMFVLTLLLSTAWVAAQEYPQTGSKHGESTASGQATVQGCLQGSNGSYTLTSESGTTYQLQGDTSKLSKHVGHEVQITGTPSGSGSATSENSNAGTSGSGSQQTLMVDNVKQISKSCSNTSKY